MTFIVEVDRSGLDRGIAAHRRAIDLLVERVAEELSHTAGEEARQASSRLGRDWPIEGRGSRERDVVAPEFFAHFLARGTVAHGPRRAKRLVFMVEGRLVFATQVEGVPANPFDERAMRRTERRVDDIFASLVREVA